MLHPGKSTRAFLLVGKAEEQPHTDLYGKENLRLCRVYVRAKGTQVSGAEEEVPHQQDQICLHY